MTQLRTAFASALILMLSAGLTLAGEFGSRDEAKAMLEHAVKVLQADKGRALDMFTNGMGGFVDRDLYVFCGGPDGMLTAHPYVPIGTTLREFTDMTGKAVGEEIYAAAEEGRIAEVSYKWMQPGGGMNP